MKYVKINKIIMPGYLSSGQPNGSMKFATGLEKLLGYLKFNCLSINQTLWFPGVLTFS